MQPKKLIEIMDVLKNNTYNHFDYYKYDRLVSKTFREVHDDICKVLSFFKEKNLKPRARVGIIGINCYEWILIDLACIVGGYIAVAFSKDIFKLQLNNVVNRYTLDLLFTDMELYKNIKNKKDVYTFDSLYELPQSHDDFIIPKIQTDSIFTIIFTSGTTSFPKAMEVNNKVIDNFVNCMNTRFKIDHDDKIIVYLPLNALAQRLFIYGAILFQFNIIMTPLMNLMKTIMSEKPTILQGVPFFFSNIFDLFLNGVNSSHVKKIAYGLYKLLKKILPVKLINPIRKAIYSEFKQFWGGRIKYIVSGTAPINKKIIEFYFDAGLPLYETYGLTETGITTIGYPDNNKIGSVGKPFENKEVKIGENGQILVRSEYTWAKRYLDADEEFNNQVFRKDGFIATGDLGYIDEDGYLYVTGRLKEMIVLSNGYKYHPRVIEERLDATKYIRQSAIFGEGQPQLSAVIIKRSSNVTEKQLQMEIDKVNKELPEFAQIKHIVIGDEDFTPKNGCLTPNLKLNRDKIFKIYQKRLNFSDR